jgi:hypothetical protein
MSFWALLLVTPLHGSTFCDDSAACLALGYNLGPDKRDYRPCRISLYRLSQTESVDVAMSGRVISGRTKVDFRRRGFYGEGERVLSKQTGKPL